MKKATANWRENLNRIRKAKRITLVELATKIGVGQDVLAQIELGEVTPKQELADQILSTIENWRKEGPFIGEMKNPEDFKSFRKKCRMTIVELSAITGVSQVQIARFERGEASLPEETLELLIGALENPCGFSKN